MTAGRKSQGFLERLSGCEAVGAGRPRLRVIARRRLIRPAAPDVEAATHMLDNVRE